MMNEDAAELARLERENEALRNEVQTYRAAYQGAQLRLAPVDQENVRLVDENVTLRERVRTLEAEVRAALGTVDRLDDVQSRLQAILDAIRADVPAPADDRQAAALADFRNAYAFFQKCWTDETSAETGAWKDAVDWLRKANAELYAATSETAA